MNKFKQVLGEIKKNKENIEQGKVNCIPFQNFPRLSTKVPGIIQGTGIILTASSGIGKSQLTKSMFVLDPLDWVSNNQNKGLDIKIIYFALEESTEEFIYTMICNKLHKQFKIKIDPLELASLYADKKVTDDLIEKIDSLSEYFEWFFTKVDIVDSTSNPYGIYKYMRDYSNDNGIHYYYNFKTDKEKKKVINRAEYDKIKKFDENLAKQYAYSHYEANNPNEYVLCIVDHISLLQPENGSNLHAAMGDFSASYARKQITKHWNYITVQVQQQSAATEDNIYNKAGSKIIDKLKPSLAGLADNKLTQRDQHLILGLFAPNRHEVEDYLGYDILKLNDNFRSLSILKNRIGRGNIEVPLYFNGAITQFKELPNPMTEADYKKIEEVQKQMR